MHSLCTDIAAQQRTAVRGQENPHAQPIPGRPRRASPRSAPWRSSAPPAAGKTSLAEALLARAGAIAAPGTLERGSTVSDFDPLERRMQHSLNAAVMHLHHADTRVHFIDTPGGARLPRPEPAGAGSGGDRGRGHQRRRRHRADGACA